MRLLIFLISISLVIPAFGQKAKKKEDEITGHVQTDGIVYALPKAGIRVKIETTCTWFSAGPYAKYAEQLLGISDVETSNSTNWKIDDVSMTTFSEPDPENTFKSSGRIASLLNLTPSGCLSGINSEKSADLPEKLVVSSYIKDRLTETIPSFLNLTGSSMYLKGDSTNNYRVSRISTDKKAAEIAARIIECRKTRYEIAAGLLDELPRDGEAYKESLEELDKIEKEYLALFVGKIHHKQNSFVFDFVPPSKPLKNEVLFRFDEERGVLPASDLSGKPVVIEIQPVGLISAKEIAVSDTLKTSKIFYRIPTVAEVKIIHELQVISYGRIVFPQMGVLDHLPEELLDGTFSIDFHPQTGAVKSIRKNEK